MEGRRFKDGRKGGEEGRQEREIKEGKKGRG